MTGRNFDVSPQNTLALITATSSPLPSYRLSDVERGRRLLSALRTATPTWPGTRDRLLFCFGFERPTAEVLLLGLRFPRARATSLAPRTIFSVPLLSMSRANVTGCPSQEGQKHQSRAALSSLAVQQQPPVPDTNAQSYRARRCFCFFEIRNLCGKWSSHVVGVTI